MQAATATEAGPLDLDRPSTSSGVHPHAHATPDPTSGSTPLTCDTHPSTSSATSSQPPAGPHRSPGDPQPGPSTSAAEFDLEVFDSGSSCSLEECWAVVGSVNERKKYHHSKSGGLASGPKSRVKNPLITRASATGPPLNTQVICQIEEEEGSDGSDIHPPPFVPPVFSHSSSIDDESGPPELAPGLASAQVPESACPSETDGEDEDEGCLCAASCISLTAEAARVSQTVQPPSHMEDRLQVVDRWECGSGDERDPPSTSGSQPDPTSPARAGPSVASAPTESASTSQLVASPENIDAIVQDHDTFGTDENEDSLDSMSTSMDDLMTQSTADSSFAQQHSRGGPEGPSAASSSSSSSLSRTLSVVETAETLSEVIELESCHPIKRKSSRSGYEGPDDETQEGLSRIKKQCVARESHPALDDEETMPGNEDSCPTGASEPRSIALVEITSYPAGPNERSKLIPDKANPPSEILNWVDTFGGWSHAERLLAIDQLISACQPTQVRHMLAVIEPQFQRDFIFLLPKELSLYVLSFLSPRDLLRAAQTCRYWRILCEDNLLWREKFREAGLMDHDFKETMRARARRASSTVYNFPYSPWKSSFMRQHKIEMNWRVRPVRQPKVLKGHDDHVITCLQFSDNRIVSGSDDNTLKVWSAVNGKCLRTLVGHTGGVWSSQMEGGTIVSGSTDRTLKVWNAETGTCVHTLYGHTSTVRCMHLHKNRVVSGSRDATLRIWDIQTSECLHVLTGHVAAVRCVQYNGRLVVSGAYDYLVKVWNPDTEECLHTLSGHTNRVYSLQFDGIHVVSGSLDTSIRVWDVETGACKHALMGHQSLTSGMELRNNILVSGNADSTVKVWDITSGQCLQTLSGPNKHQSAVTCLQFNSKFVITSSDDGTVKLWDVKTGDFIRDLVALESGGSGGVVWRIRANSTKLVCAVGSRNGTEETKLMVLDFEANEANAIKQ